MRIIQQTDQMHRIALKWRKAGETVALVPTMGALHRGHLKLITEARKKADRVVVSIYVNPAQFGPKEDFSTYPRPLKLDSAACRLNGADVIFCPPDLYLPDHSIWVTENSLSLGRCEKTRPDHFRGVATIVLKLFNLVQPHFAYFGLKDAQQVQVIQRMVRDLNVPVRIIPVEIVRDSDGVALSSRNQNLSPKERADAQALPTLLYLAVTRTNPVRWLSRALAKSPGIKLDYVELAEGRLCVAIWVGKTRLIDNIPYP